ncbi:hypothetical protein ARMGADRAFT_1084728 [Armillaria gallica]|uniref:Ketoreductase (KR) domain-containing protein n=1 Tax=Armillaria gallica TaxID=47427 RepID=A0A2H3D2T8_ARMGA|nr:hypothetical protein ARMGADRAFT_1084728 [Armillaria gallica]
MAPRTREQWLADQTRPMPAVGTADLSGKMLVLIGANTGLGFEAAKHFAKASFSIGLRRRLTIFIITGIQKETGYTKAELWIIDLANFSSVVAFANRA